MDQIHSRNCCSQVSLGNILCSCLYEQHSNSSNSSVCAHAFLCVFYLVTARVHTVTTKQQPTITQPHPPSRCELAARCCFPPAIVAGTDALLAAPSPGRDLCDPAGQCANWVFSWGGRILLDAEKSRKRSWGFVLSGVNECIQLASVNQSPADPQSLTGLPMIVKNAPKAQLGQDSSLQHQQQEWQEAHILCWWQPSSTRSG